VSCAATAALRGSRPVRDQCTGTPPLNACSSLISQCPELRSSTTRPELITSPNPPPRPVPAQPSSIPTDRRSVASVPAMNRAAACLLRQTRRPSGRHVKAVPFVLSPLQFPGQLSCHAWVVAVLTILHDPSRSLCRWMTSSLHDGLDDADTGANTLLDGCAHGQHAAASTVQGQRAPDRRRPDKEVTASSPRGTQLSQACRLSILSPGADVLPTAIPTHFQKRSNRDGRRRAGPRVHVHVQKRYCN
jgi:hypothetical protein